MVKAQRHRDIKEAAAEAARGRRLSKRNPRAQILGRDQELEEAQREINAAGMEKYCSVTLEIAVREIEYQIDP